MDTLEERINTDGELCRLTREGDLVAADALVRRHTGLVKKIAFKYQFWKYSVEDTIQNGFIGLLTAARTFRPEQGCQFSTYASRVITTSILSTISAGLGVHGARRAFWHWARAHAELEALGESTSDVSVAEHLGVKIQDVEAARACRDRPALVADISTPEKPAIVPVDQRELPDVLLENESEIAEVRREIATFPPRTQDIMHRVIAGETRGAIAKRYKLSRVRVQQIQEKTIACIRKRILQRRKEELR